MNERTTPAWARIPVLIGLALFVAYQALCASFTLGRAQPTGILDRHPGILWAATWEMFTRNDPGNKAILARTYVDGSFEPVDLEAVFTTQWESGPRYQRLVTRFPTVAEIVAHSLCERMPDARAVELSKAVWAKERGRADLEPPPDADHSVILLWRCDQTPAFVPQGRRL